MLERPHAINEIYYWGGKNNSRLGAAALLLELLLDVGDARLGAVH
jgi:hypothetical protein